MQVKEVQNDVMKFEKWEFFDLQLKRLKGSLYSWRGAIKLEESHGHALK